MKKILLLTDFSEASRYALTFTRAFFSDTVADFHLLCVPPLEDSNGFDSPIHVAETDRTGYDDQLHDTMMALRREVTTNWHTFRSSSCPGHLRDIVEQSLKRETYDFVVLGASADGTCALFGTNTIALTRQLKANVLVVPVDTPTRSVRRVVLAADFANLKNAKLLGPIKELVTLKGAALTLLTVDIPTKKAIQGEQEIHLRKFLAPIEPTVARMKADRAWQGIDAYLADHTVDVLVMIPECKNSPGELTGDVLAYTPPVAVLTLYDDGSDDRPQRISALLNADYAL